MATLKKGSKGKPVAQLQTALNKNGASPKLKVDEIFGPKTEAGVKAFQKSKKLKVDGIAGEITAFACGIGPRPKSMTIDVSEYENSVKSMHEWLKRFDSGFSKYSEVFKAAAKDTDKLKATLLQREQKFSDRHKSFYKDLGGVIAKFDKTTKDLLKKYETSVSPAEFKEIKTALDNEVKAIVKKQNEDPTKIAAKKTVQELLQYLKAVKALEAKVGKI